MEEISEASTSPGGHMLLPPASQGSTAAALQKSFEQLLSAQAAAEEANAALDAPPHVGGDLDLSESFDSDELSACLTEFAGWSSHGLHSPEDSGTSSSVGQPSDMCNGDMAESVRLTATVPAEVTTPLALLAPTVLAQTCPQLRGLADASSQQPFEDPETAMHRLRPPEHQAPSFCKRARPTSPGYRLPLMAFACSPRRHRLQSAVQECLRTTRIFHAVVYDHGTPEEFQEALNEHNPAAVLMVGHSNLPYRNAQTFAFTDNAGEIHAITDDLLAELLGQADLDLAFLNGCSSYALARKAIAKNVRFVICWKTRVADTAASAFSIAFFKNFKVTRDVEDAFKKAKLALLVGTRLSSTWLDQPLGVPRWELRDPDDENELLTNPLADGAQAAGIPVLLYRDPVDNSEREIL